jgi:hypothetical protein
MSTEIIRSIPTENYLITATMDLALARQRLQEFQAFVKEYLIEGEDFGKIPGAPKPCLLKPGADKLCELYGLSDDYEFIDRVEDFDRGIFDYTIKCILTDRRHGIMISAGLGSCNSLEQKYRWRDSRRACPQCGKEAIIKGKEEYGGGWLCFAKKGGCGAKFAEDDPSIMEQPIGRTVNEDVADQKNTILKMAKKRSKIDATLSATRSSGVFTQDIEDMPHMANVMPPPVAQVQDALEPEYVAIPKTNPSNTERDMWLTAFADAATLDEFNQYIVPLMKERGREFIVASAEEAKRRGYTADRATGLYKEKVKK